MEFKLIELEKRFRLYWRLSSEEIETIFGKWKLINVLYFFSS